MRHKLIAATAATLLLVPAAVIGQTQLGYLPAGAIDVIKILPPPPAKGDATYSRDRAAFKQTRKWIGTPRWDMATADVRTDMASTMKDFSCSVGVALTPENAPRIATVMRKTGIDERAQSVAAKNAFARLRPYQIDKGKTCQNPEELKDSFDYPSGHTIWGWTWGQLLAEMAPDRATQVLARARSFGESRIVCGVHNVSAVDAGRLASSATLAAIHAQPAFRDDIAAARVELAALRDDPKSPKPEGCDAEAALVATPIY